MFSNGFSEGQTRDINDGFPADAPPFTDSYDNLSDSDLEDDDSKQPNADSDSGPEISAKTSESLPQASQFASRVETHVSALYLLKPHEQSS